MILSVTQAVRLGKVNDWAVGPKTNEVCNFNIRASC